MYRTIYTELWTDPDVDQLSPQGKCLFVYLITNPHTHVSGIYYLPKQTMVLETKIQEKALDTLLDTLSGLSLAYYDQVKRVIYVTKMFRYQGRGEKNERAAAKHLESLHETSLITRFLEIYPSVSQYLSDTLSHTLSDLGKSCPSVPNPNPSSLPSSPERPRSLKKESDGRASVLPVEFTFDDRASQLAASFGLNPLKEFAAFKDHAAAKGRICKDWQAAFRNWLRNSVKFKEARR